MDESTTRRRILQGAGIVGVTGLTGTALVTAQQDTPTEEGAAAVRVAHTSPDAPPVTVTLDGETLVDSLEFGEVSNYAEVEPGTGQLQVIADGQGPLGGVLDDLFGTTEDGETLLVDREIEVPGGEAITAVAFGLAAQGGATQAGTPTPDGTATPTTTPGEGTAEPTTPGEETVTGEATPTEGTVTDGETPTEDIGIAEETPTAGETEEPATPGEGTGTEEPLTPGETTEEPVTPDGTPAEGTETPDGTPTEGTETAGGTPTEGTETPTEGGQGPGAVVEGLAFGEAASFTLDGGNYNFLIRPTDTEEETATPDGGTATETPTEGVPGEETPTGETPAGVEETPTGGVTGEETPTDGVTGEETPTDGVTGEETPAVGIQETPTDGVTGEETPTDGVTGAETPTDGVEETPTEGVTGEETPTEGVTGAETPTEGTPTEDSTGGERPFQVELLVDDLSNPPGRQSRIRAFHAVPDVDEVTIVATPRLPGQDPGQGQGQGQGGGQGQGQGPSRSVDVSLDINTVYAGFATGYFNPQAAPTPEDGELDEEELPELDFVLAASASDGERADGSSAGN